MTTTRDTTIEEMLKGLEDEHYRLRVDTAYLKELLQHTNAMIALLDEESLCCGDTRMNAIDLALAMRDLRATVRKMIDENLDRMEAIDDSTRPFQDVKEVI